MSKEDSRLTFIDLFAGIGGFSLGLERAGMRCVAQVEIDDYCREVLKKHWPAVPCHYDITTIDWRDIQPVDLLCGGPPCQPFSLAGKRLAGRDQRDLWPETIQAVRTLRPRWVFFENTVGVEPYLAANVLPALEREGYRNTPWGEIVPLDIPAWAVGAPHRRHRVWIVAHFNGSGHGVLLQQEQECRRSQAANAGSNGKARHSADVASAQCCTWALVTSGPTRDEARRQKSQRYDGWKTEPDVVRVVHGVRARLDCARIKALGNSIVPQIAEALGRMILDVDRGMRRR